MFLERSSRLHEFAVSAVILMLAHTQTAFCQTGLTPENELPPPDEIEEIVVYGEKSMTQLRLELHRAEENFFDVFNSLNSKKEFDVRCDYIVPIETRRRQHVCTPLFAMKLQEQAAQDMVATNMQYSTTPLGALLKKKEKLMWKEMATLVAEQPEMQAAYARLMKANSGMDAERQRRCEDRGILCKK